ncbi:hypothetical protein [Helicobacter acinonychis]|uniref:hypothetical protein n=1 Tax=Helicobacter acinonychis TaxID=212 RepID=UPI000CF186D9|nr:hypothetical protein [Helicobacter acinonychis]
MLFSKEKCWNDKRAGKVCWNEPFIEEEYGMQDTEALEESEKEEEHRKEAVKKQRLSSQIATKLWE